MWMCVLFMMYCIYIMNFGKQILFPGIVLLALDFVYMNLLKNRFQRQIIQIQRTTVQFRPWGALGCYFLLISGIYYFILRTHRPVEDAFFLGVLIYGVYETTNFALFKNWDPLLLAGDTLWGGVLFATVTWYF